MMLCPSCQSGLIEIDNGMMCGHCGLRLEIKAQPWEDAEERRARELEYAQNLAEMLHTQHYKGVEFEPESDMMLVLMQIADLVADLTRKTPKPRKSRDFPPDYMHRFGVGRLNGD